MSISYSNIYQVHLKCCYNAFSYYLTANLFLHIARFAYSYTVDIERLRDAYREAKQNPADEVTFKWLRLNMWVSSTTAWIPDAIFMKGSDSIDMRLLEGRDCYAGFTMVPFGQGFADMSTPTKEFYRLLMECQIVHAGHPVLRWMAGNVVIETDAAENIKVTKGYLYHYDANVLNSMMESFVSWEDRPMACSMDICVTKDGRILLVEFNDAYSLGAYGLPDIYYAKLISARRSQLLGVKDEFYF